jgi:hypothetical protein
MSSSVSGQATESTSDEQKFSLSASGEAEKAATCALEKRRIRVFGLVVRRIAVRPFSARACDDIVSLEAYGSMILFLSCVSLVKTRDAVFHTKGVVDGG